MLHTDSPWRYELKKRDPYLHAILPENADIVIVGGGIAGISTAYFILKNTKKSVLLLEQNTIASGATGHNAGQIVSYFEKPFSEIVKEYSVDLAIAAQNDILSAWSLLENIVTDVKLKTPMHIFRGLSGCTRASLLLEHLESRYLRPPVDFQEEFCLVADDAYFLSEIPEKFKNLYTIVPRHAVLDLLETKNQQYAAAFTSKKGCMNSAMFCEELTQFMLSEYSERFTIAEHTHVSQVTLEENLAELELDDLKLTAQKVVLCTNGFESIKIINKAGKTINGSFHEAVRGKIGFMKAYTLKNDREPIAVSYHEANPNWYFYVTRRPSGFSSGDGYNLVAIGGPEYFIPEKAVYRPGAEFPPEILEKLDDFIQHTRIDEYRDRYEHMFLWHGLMGYTKNGLRIIGPDKYNKNLLYNLGCNGVGILPSIFGGKKIAAFLNNQIHTPSVFDPYF